MQLISLADSRDFAQQQQQKPQRRVGEEFGVGFRPAASSLHPSPGPFPALSGSSGGCTTEVVRRTEEPAPRAKPAGTMAEQESRSGEPSLPPGWAGSGRAQGEWG